MAKLPQKLKMGAIMLKKKAAVLSSVSFTLLFILLTKVGWLVFLGGFIAFSVENGGAKTVACYTYLPHFFIAVASAILLTICFIEAVLLVLAPANKPIHILFITFTYILASPLLAFIGAILHPIGLKYFLDVTIITTDPIYNTAMYAGLIIEAVFLGLTLLMLNVTGYMTNPQKGCNKMEEVEQEKGRASGTPPGSEADEEGGDGNGGEGEGEGEEEAVEEED